MIKPTFVSSSVAQSLAFAAILFVTAAFFHPGTSQASQYHPADINNDSHIDLANDNVNNYFLCWRTGCNWALTNPSNPGPGPTDPAFQSYMQSAAFIWKSGEAYYYDSTQACPQCYVPGVGTAGAWVKQAGGAGNDSGFAVTVDSNGNSYIAGYFSGTATFGSVNLVSNGGVGLFIAKYDNAGTQQWVRGYSGTSGGVSPTGIALDSGGNLFISGYFTGVANLGGSNLVSAGQQDSFIAKYSPQGQHLWSQSFGGTGSDVFNGLAVDSQGNVVVAGWFQALYPATVSFGGTGLYSTKGGINVILAKYSPTGAYLWSETFANAGSPDYTYGIAVDKRVNPLTGLAYDSIMLTGSFFNWINFGGGQITNVSSNPDLFVAKFTPSGAYVWARGYGGLYGTRGSTIAVDGNGDAVVGGIFTSQTDLGGGTVIGTASDSDMFLAKYSGMDGSYLWGKALLGNYGGLPNGVACDAQNNIVLTGYFYGTFNFGSQLISSVNNSYDIFVAKYSAASTPVWAKSFGGASADEGVGITIDGTGYPIVTGFFGGSALFGSTTLTSAGSYDAFIMRLNP